MWKQQGENPIGVIVNSIIRKKKKRSFDVFVFLLQGYCYNSECPLHDEQCQDLWGPGMNFLSPKL